MKKYMGVLQKCPLFDGISPENLSGMLGCLGARKIQARKGTAVFREGDKAAFVGIVVEGSVQMIREDFFGNRSIVTRAAVPQLFGESYAFSGAEALPVSVVAEEDSTILLLDSRRITACCSNACSFHNQVIYNLLRVTANKNLLLHQKIQITSKRTTREKLMTYLMTQAKQHGSNSFTIPYDRQELADYLEVDRSGLSAEISKLRKEGILVCERSSFCLLKTEPQES